MAELSTLARPYAKAAFQYAAEQQKVDQWAEMLNLAAVVSEQDKVSRLINSPAESSDQLAATMTDLCSGKMVDHGANLFGVLAQNKRMALLPQISQQFQKLQAEREHIVDVDITSAFELSSEELQRLSEKLRQKLDCDVNINTSIDRDLIGGVIIRAGDMVIDGSVRGKLGKLAEDLNQ